MYFLMSWEAWGSISFHGMPQEIQVFSDVLGGSIFYHGMPQEVPALFDMRGGFDVFQGL